MEQFDVNEKRPPSLLNVLVKYNMHYQDFWTRGFLSGDTWTVMTWGGQIEVPKSSITYWMYLPNFNTRKD